MGRKVKVQEIISGNKIRIAAIVYKLSSDPPKVKKEIDENRNAARRWLYFRKMQDKLNELIEQNFSGDDWAIVLSVDNSWVSGEYKRLRGEWRRALARLRYARRKRGRPEPVYLYAIEGKHGDKHPHIHILMKKSDCPEEDISELHKVWKCGELFMDDFKNVKWYDNPAKYLTKEPNKFVPRKLDVNCYVASHNCQRPIIPPPYYVENLADIILPEGYIALRDNTYRTQCGELKGGSVVAISRFITLEAIEQLPSCNGAEDLMERRKSG